MTDYQVTCTNCGRKHWVETLADGTYMAQCTLDNEYDQYSEDKLIPVEPRSSNKSV